MTIFTLLTLVISVLGSIATLYRVWQVVKKRPTFKNNFAYLIYVLTILFVLIAFAFSWLLFYQYVWPGHLATGKGGYKVVFSIEVELIAVTIGYLVSEAIRSVCIRKASNILG